MSISFSNGSGSHDYAQSSVPAVSLEASNAPVIRPSTSEKNSRFPFVLPKIIGDRKTTKDGQIQRRRGPKPDSKPAVTRRQELNRQAQRTHRERKEKYIEFLEAKAVTEEKSKNAIVKEREAAIAQRDAAWEENDRLKELLRMHRIPYEHLTARPSLTSNQLPVNQSMSPTWQQSSTGGSISIDNDSSRLDSSASNSASRHGPSPTSATTSNGSFPIFVDRSRIKHEPSGLNNSEMTQVFVDFILALESVCHDHQQMLCERSVNLPQTTYHGHSLMISCPPRDHVVQNPGVAYPHKAPDLPTEGLMNLLASSDNLPLTGEITPVQALRVIRTHPRFYELAGDDFKLLEEALKPLCRCYGFGAAVEDFVVHDAINQVFAAKFKGFDFNDLSG